VPVDYHYGGMLARNAMRFVREQESHRFPFMQLYCQSPRPNLQ
jgi:hypothetical protein